MLKLFILLSFVLIPVISLSQINLDTLNFADCQNLRNSAERKIIIEDYDSSSNLYKNLYNNCILWNDDAYNALYASLLSKNSENVELFVLELLRRGENPDRLASSLDTFSFFNSRKWLELKSQSIEFSYDTLLRKEIIEMHKIDQNDRYDYANRLADDLINLVELHRITLERGFPTELDLGICHENRYDVKLRIILLHLVKLQPWDFGEYLQNWYFNGKLSPTHFIRLFSNARTCDDFQLTCFGPPATNVWVVDDVWFSCNDSDFKRINSNRKFFHLETVQEQIEKVKFRLRNEIPWRFTPGFGTVHYNLQKEDFDSFSEELFSEGYIIYEREKNKD